MPEFTAKELKNMTPEQLAILGERNHPLSAEGILIREEWERRRIEEQHSTQTPKPWHETFTGKIIVSIVGGIILFLLTTLIAKHFISSTSKQTPPAIVQGPALTYPERVTIDITNVPPSGDGQDSMKTIAGIVKGMEHPQEFRVVVYALSDGVWYVQPQEDQVFTVIQPDGSWNTDTHLGSEYASLVVRSTFRTPAQSGALPGGVDVIAMTRRDGR